MSTFVRNGIKKHQQRFHLMTVVKKKWNNNAVTAVSKTRLLIGAGPVKEWDYDNHSSYGTAIVSVFGRNMQRGCDTRWGSRENARICHRGSLKPFELSFSVFLFSTHTLSLHYSSPFASNPLTQHFFQILYSIASHLKEHPFIYIAWNWSLSFVNKSFAVYILIEAQKPHCSLFPSDFVFTISEPNWLVLTNYTHISHTPSLRLCCMKCAVWVNMT